MKSDVIGIGLLTILFMAVIWFTIYVILSIGQVQGYAESIEHYRQNPKQAYALYIESRDILNEKIKISYEPIEK